MTDTSRSSHARLDGVPVRAVALTDGLWKRWRDTNHYVSLPNQFDELEKTERLRPFRRACGDIAEGPIGGKFAGDSDVYKWAEAAAFSLASYPDPALEGKLDELIDLIARAQEPDGYLFTKYQHGEGREALRWTDLKRDHELYCGGHLIQAALAHRRVTGKDSLFNVALKWADHVCNRFGPGKTPGACGHPEVEMALVELYRETRERKYLEEAIYFIEARGQEPPLLSGSEDLQDHLPIRRQTYVTGHAVRQLYLAAGVADIYAEIGDATLMRALKMQWRDFTTRKMSVTGGCGVFRKGEGFGVDFELPNRTAYNETCAAIASVMWNWRMLLATADGRYADLIEHTLYNAVLPGVSLDGKGYFYTNPLEHHGRGDLAGSGRGSNVRSRVHWDHVACCPPNVARTLAALPGYIYGVSSEAVYVHQYAASKALIEIGGRALALEQETRYPWEGHVRIKMAPAAPCEFDLCLRIPAWSRQTSLRVNDAPVPDARARKGYVILRRRWQQGDCVDLKLSLEIRQLLAHPRATECNGCVALARGPVIYCIESVDHPGLDIFDLVLSRRCSLKYQFRPRLLGGVGVVRAKAGLRSFPAGRLYVERDDVSRTTRETELTAVPYFAWANRRPGAMRVWNPAARSLIKDKRNCSSHVKATG